MSELIINESNFSEYFRDCRVSRPERDDIIACYTASAEFVEGNMKRDVIDLLVNHDKALAAIQVMRKLGGATQVDAIKICKEICKDLIFGMNLEEVEKKPYKYNVEFFYYTKKEFVPIDDHHWSIIGIMNLDEFLDKSNQRLKIHSRVIGKEPEKEG
jgi:hypothetical protein